MELEGFTERSLLTLSGGERQRAAIARVLAQEAPTLVLDEPLAHLDPRYQKRLLEFLVQHCQKKQEEGGGSVALALHDLRLARQWCHSVALLQRGQLIAYGAPEEALTASRLQDVFGIDPEFIG
jgi:iron complex transport system ATP-binding protein